MTEHKPLPSDIIQDPDFWPEWELDENYNVVPSSDNNNNNNGE